MAGASGEWKLAGAAQGALVAERESVARVIAALTEKLQTVPQLALEEARPQMEQRAVSRWAERYNQAARRMRQAQSAEEWGSALAEAAEAEGVAVFRLTGETLFLAGVQGQVSATAEASLREKGLPRRKAPALANALDTQDTVVALRAAQEVSNEMIELFPQVAGAKAYLFPLSAQRKATGLVYLLPGEQKPDVNSLEILAALGEASWQERPVRESTASLLSIAAAAAPQPSAKRDWDALTAPERDLHLRAQNFARTQVARLLLREHGAVRTAREMGNLYLAMQKSIDEDRRSFRERFLQGQPTMVDYLHLELVRTLAEGNATLLGAEYPGPLV